MNLRVESVYSHFVLTPGFAHQTLYQRVLDSEYTSKSAKSELKRQYKMLNPTFLKRKISRNFFVWQRINQKRGAHIINK